MHTALRLFYLGSLMYLSPEYRQRPNEMVPEIVRIPSCTSPPLREERFFAAKMYRGAYRI
jgi:hypothetical protein